MFCKEFNENGWLYLSDELDGESGKYFEEHIQHCTACQAQLAEARQWSNVIDKLPLHRPSGTIRKSILREAKASCPPKEHTGFFRKWQYSLSFGLPGLAAAALLLLILIKPWNHSDTQVVDILMWDDSVAIEMIDLSLAIITMEKDYNENYENDDVDFLEETTLSVFHDELSDLRTELENYNSMAESI
ncbi:zf-HC2 domain-containing protein [bacterium]|nr:zf-HC2 domain-containing protein [bacterium]